MLSAVPSQSAPKVPTRDEAFRRVVEEALQLSGPEACARIMQQYSADMRAFQARVEGLQQEASDVATQKRQFFTMLQQVQTAASSKIWESAKMTAEVATYREMFAELRGLAQKAQGEPIPWESVSAVLSIEPMEPSHAPASLAFLPSEQFRGGQFVSHPVPDVTFVFTFIGWSLIDHGPGAWGIVEPMFLVEDRALPRSVIEHERHVKLESYLPQLEMSA